MTNGHSVFQGAEVAPDGVDLALQLQDWLTLNPDDREAWEAVRKLGNGQKSEELPSWTWSKAPQPTPRRWLVQDWLPTGRVSMLAGPGGVGKSRLALQLAAGIASGGDENAAWLEAPVEALRLGESVIGKGAPVVYATWEDEPEEFGRRLSEISGAAAPWVKPELLDNLEVINLAQFGPVWAPVENRHISTIAELTNTGKLLRQRCEVLNARLLVLDPLAAAYAGDENARGLVRAFVADWDGWAQTTDCAVFLVAHPPKSGNSGYSGSTDWEAAVRSRWELDKTRRGEKPKTGEDKRPDCWRLDLPKRNYSPERQAVELTWDTSEGGLRWRANWWEEDHHTLTGNERKRYD